MIKYTENKTMGAVGGEVMDKKKETKPKEEKPTPKGYSRWDSFGFKVISRPSDNKGGKKNG